MSHKINFKAAKGQHQHQKHSKRVAFVVRLLRMTSILQFTIKRKSRTRFTRWSISERANEQASIERKAEIKKERAKNVLLEHLAPSSVRLAVEKKLGCYCQCSLSIDPRMNEKEGLGEWMKEGRSSGSSIAVIKSATNAVVLNWQWTVCNRWVTNRIRHLTSSIMLNADCAIVWQ